jgi:hypothetical protein
MSFSVVRVVTLTASQIIVLFNDDIDTNVGVSNVTISSTVSSISDTTVTSVVVDGDEITVNFRPIFANVQYLVTFLSVSAQNFQTTSSEIISEDGSRNAFFIVGPQESNSIKDDMLDSLSVVYETEEPSLIQDLVTSTANRLLKVEDTIATVKSSNYLSVLVEDEKITRGSGPIDKFSNGGVFELLRVGSSVTGATRTRTLRLDTERHSSFLTNSYIIANDVLKLIGTDPVSLQSVDVINESVTDDTDLNNYFDGLTIQVANRSVVQLISVTLRRGNIYTPYDVNTFGYTLRDNQYDTDHALINVNLTDQQIQLSSSSITGEEGGFLTPIAGDSMTVSYVYKRLGREVSDVGLYTLEQSVREVTPATITSFYLDYAPIVLSGDTIPTSGGVSFLNTITYSGSAPFTTSHPAFLSEIPFDLGKTPQQPGQFSVNYTTGQVLVYGEDATNQGTGSNSPVATYYYRNEFVEDLDFTFDTDTEELALNSTRDLSGMEAKITLSYEDTFAEDEDYEFLSHIESLDERVDNRLISDFAVQTEHFPISDVFRVFNETTGEIYSTTRFNDTTIYFSGQKAPTQEDIVREKTSFSLADQETLYVSDELTNTYDLLVFVIELANSGLGDSKQRFIGANFDSSVVFSNSDIFQEERFYEDELFTSVTTNINRFTTIGDYSIDYTNGIVYVAVEDDQGSDLGRISYRYSDIQTKNDHILKVDNVYRSGSALSSSINTYVPSGITDDTISITGLESVGERFINSNSVRPLLIGTYQSGEDGITTNGSNLFTSNSGIFTASDVGRLLVIGSSSNIPVQQVEISQIVNDHQVIVEENITYTGTGRVWVILDLSSDADKTITLENDIISINEIYLASQIGTVPFSSLDGYYDISRDSFSGNVITLGASNPLSIGSAVVVNYNYGNIYTDYLYLKDEVLISYEYGNNSIDWSISSSLSEDDEYYVTYRYGALREPLLLNFGSLTQIPILTNFPYDFDREVYRSVVAGTLQSFVKGPTIPALEQLVEAFTGVTPAITEYAFNNWVLGRDYLNLQKAKSKTTASYDIGKFDNGISIEAGQNVQIPAISHLRLEEGTLEAWVRPSWKGLANDATVTFDLYKDGYRTASSVFIGFDAVSPTEIPFSLSSASLSVTGQPKNIDSEVGYFIWYNEFSNQWNMRWRECNDTTHEFIGSITTSGEFFNIAETTGDGYDINEITDLVTSSTEAISFTAAIDGYEPEVECSSDGIIFSSGDTHYLLDTAGSEDANRISIFKDGAGYLNFRIMDNDAGVYNIATYVGDWTVDELHHLAISWKTNSYNEKDEMHLFVDGQEVPNLFKYGGNPSASDQYDFGDVGEEIVVSLATQPTVGGYDGVSEAGSILFRSVGVNFEAAGVSVGDSLYILEENADGTEDDLGGVYTITGVGLNTLALNRAPTLSLGSINFSVNPVVATVTTAINLQKFAVFTTDASGNETELNGVDTSEPDYAVSRGSDYTHILTIMNGVEISDSVIIKTFGLIFRRYKGQVYVYENNNSNIRTNSPYPATLGDVDITPILLSKRLVSQYNDEFTLLANGTLYSSFGADGYESQFRDGYFTYEDDGYVCQPSNTVRGRRLSATLSGDNINYSVNGGNRIVIAGEIDPKLFVEEILYFTENETVVSTQYWTKLETVSVFIVPVDSSAHAGTIEIREYKPINESENNGDYAEIVEYDNGVFSVEIYGSGGMPFELDACSYEIDYPTFLKISIDAMSDMLFIGSDFEEANEFDGIVDEFRILNTMYDDLRTGEVSSDGKNITSDYSRTRALPEDNNTTLLMHFDNNLDNSADYVDSFDSGFEVAESVNTSFGNAIKVSDDRTYEISNAASIFNNDEGTIEFWVSPLRDSEEDPNMRYFIDMSSSILEEVESYTKLNLTISQRIREIISIRLLSDTENIRTDYYVGGSISNVDGRTITLGTPLPFQNTMVKVDYIPLNVNGDRVSIFKGRDNAINFFMKANEVEHMISVHIDWDRNTWHRIMAMWLTNSSDNNDRLRLFVDGQERGTIKYGTGLIYGTGVVYGQAEIRAGVNRFVVDNIDLLDSFPKIYVGTDIYGTNNAMARMDNLRFSEEQRLQSIRTVGSDVLDTNYNSTAALANPVVDDLITTLLINFNKEVAIIDDLITLINSERGIFRFKIEVVDSFSRIGDNAVLRQLLIDLVDTLKPAHSESIIEFVD